MSGLDVAGGLDAKELHRSGKPLSEIASMGECADNSDLVNEVARIRFDEFTQSKSGGSIFGPSIDDKLESVEFVPASDGEGAPVSPLLKVTYLLDDDFGRFGNVQRNYFSLVGVGEKNDDPNASKPYDFYRTSFPGEPGSLESGGKFFEMYVSASSIDVPSLESFENVPTRNLFMGLADEWGKHPPYKCCKVSNGRDMIPKDELRCRLDVVGEKLFSGSSCRVCTNGQNPLYLDSVGGVAYVFFGVNDDNEFNDDDSNLVRHLGGETVSTRTSSFSIRIPVDKFDEILWNFDPANFDYSEVESFSGEGSGEPEVTEEDVVVEESISRNIAVMIYHTKVNAMVICEFKKGASGGDPFELRFVATDDNSSNDQALFYEIVGSKVRQTGTLMKRIPPIEVAMRLVRKNLPHGVKKIIE
jgi:hypothetical protein